MSVVHYVDNLAQGSAVGPASAEFMQWASGHGLPASTLKLFERAWVRDDDAFVGALDLMTEQKIMRSAVEEPRWLTSGFLVIGSCDNGDMVALDLRDGPGSVWYLSHEELWGDDSADPRRFAVRVAEDLADLIERAWDVDSFPLFYGDAREQNGG